MKTKILKVKTSFQKSDLLFIFLKFRWYDKLSYQKQVLKVGKSVFGKGLSTAMNEPKVVGNLSSGQKVYWCPKKEQQIIDQVCREKYFSRSYRSCRECLGIMKGQHWPEPWASIGKEVKTVVVG